MTELIVYWMPVITALTAFVTLLLKIIELLGKIGIVVKMWKMLPYLLKLLAKFLIYGLSLVVPNIGIIWYFFYLAGGSPEGLWNPRFFWAVVTQPTIGVSIYAYVWARLIYPKLRHLLGDTNTPPRRKSRKPK